MPELARSVLLDLLSKVESFQVRSLLELLFLAHKPFQKPDVWKLFGELGVVHLIVLSGAHIQYFIRALRSQIYVLLKCFRLKDVFGAELIVSVGIFFLLAMTNYPVALLRAALCWWAGLFLERVGGSQRYLVLLPLIQIFLFPDHIGRIGFFLSWICYLMVLFSSRLRFSLLYQSVLLTLVSQGLLWFFGVEKEISFHTLGLYCLCNLAMVWCLEKFLFPFVAGILAFVFLLSFMGESVLTWGVGILSVTMLPIIISGAKIVYLAGELLRTL